MKKMTLVLMASAVSVFVLVSFAQTDQEPIYDGHPLSFWVEENWLGGPEEVRALRTIGTNGFPFLLNWLQGKLPSKPPELPSTHSFADSTTRAFEALGDDAGPMVPELTRLANDPSSSEIADRSLQALAWVGNKGVPPLLAVVRNQKHACRGRAVFILGSTRAHGSEADAVVAQLVALMSDDSVNQPAAHALGELKLRPDISVPALAVGLTNGSPNFRATCANSLIWFNDAAASALPQLTNALNDSDAAVRRAATNAAWHIRNEILRKQIHR